MAPPTAGRPLTLKAFAIWTAVLTMVLGIFLSAILGSLGRVGLVEFSVGFVPVFIAIVALCWPGRFDRLLPAAMATLIVGVWPAYRWLAHGDWATMKAFLFVAGSIDVLVLMFISMDFVKRRGWVAPLSHRRRRVFFGSILVNALSIVSGWPTGAWHTRLSLACSAMTFFCLFWPARRRPGQPNQSVTA